MNSRFRLCLAVASVSFFATASAIAGAAAPPPPAPSAAIPAAGADTGFKIIRNTPVQFPLPLLRDGINHGEARVLLEVDADGRLVDSLVVAYTHKPFADSALSAVRQWHFQPARIDGEPVGTIADCSIVFNVDGILYYVRTDPPTFEPRGPLEEKYAYQAQELVALDRIPTPQQVEEPIYLAEWAKRGMTGKVSIDFYIDETGAVRMPSSVSGRFPLLDAAATAAIRKWRFAPPLRKGRPVLAHCQQVFTFAVPQSAVSH